MCIDPTADSNYAIRMGSMDVTEAVKLFSYFYEQWCLLFDTSENGRIEVVKLLLTCPGVDPTDDNNCAIRWASQSGYTEVVKLLLTCPGVDPTAENNHAIQNASAGGHIELIIIIFAPRPKKWGLKLLNYY